MSKKRLFVIDAMALAFRSFHAILRPLSNPEGMPTQALYGSLMFLMKLIEEERPDYLVIATDSKGKTFRHDIFPEYKANRSEMPEDLAVQIPHLYKLFENLGCKVIKETGVEADDLIGSLCDQMANDDLHCYIVSGDKDFMQLVNNNVSLYQPKKGGVHLLVNEKEVFDKFGCRPDQVIDVLALIGDKADNVPGVPGIGEKGAANLIQKFGSLDGIYERVDEVTAKRQHNGLTQNKDLAYLSKELVIIKKDCVIPYSLEDMSCTPQDATGNEQLLDFCKTMGFRTLTKRVEENLSKAGTDEAISDRDNIYSANISYSTLKTRQGIQNFIQNMGQHAQFCFDTETTGLDKINDKPIGMSLSVAEYQACYIPLIEEHLEDIKPQEVIELVKPVFVSDKLKIAHNAKFDIQMLANLGIQVSGPIADTMLSAWIITPDQRSYSLDDSCLKFLNYEKIKTETLLDDKGSIVHADINSLAEYACEDADLTLRLYNYLNKKVKEMGLDSAYTKIDAPLVPVLAKMEQDGIFIDKKMLEDFSIELGEKADTLKKSIYEIAGEEFNINSPKQLQVILFENLKIHEELGIKNIKKTKSGFSTDVSVLEKLSAHPLPKAILEYRTVAKLKSTYVDTLPQLIKEDTGRIHTSFHQTGTATGRLSSSKPNLQNIPIRTPLGRNIRKAFCASSESNEIISADYSQVELRLLAELSGDENLKTAFIENKDIHTSTASKIFNISESEVNSDQRSQAKAINFGIIYGMGPQRLARETGVKTKEAKDFIEKYFASYPKIKNYIDSSIEFAREHEYSKTLSGRKRPLRDINVATGLQLSNLQNMAVNSPVQGTASDLIKLAMIDIQAKIPLSGLRLKMLVQVHDELIFECHKDDVEKSKILIKESMENAMKLSVPLKVEIESGKDWLEAH